QRKLIHMRRRAQPEMGEDGGSDRGEWDFVLHHPMLSVANPQNAVGMMSAAAHAVDYVKEIAKGPASAVTPSEDRAIHHGRVRHATAGEQVASFSPHGHERLFFDKEIAKSALGQFSLFGTEAFDVKLLGHHGFNSGPVYSHPRKFQERFKLPRPEGALGRLA